MSSRRDEQIESEIPDAASTSATAAVEADLAADVNADGQSSMRLSTPTSVSTLTTTDPRLTGDRSRSTPVTLGKFAIVYDGLLGVRTRSARTTRRDVTVRE
jgi:hypothetical protein